MSLSMFEGRTSKPLTTGVAANLKPPADVGTSSSVAPASEMISNRLQSGSGFLEQESPPIGQYRYQKSVVYDGFRVLD